jgi:hypothetical protein
MVGKWQDKAEGYQIARQGRTAPYNAALLKGF